MVQEDGTGNSRPVMARKGRDGSIWRFDTQNGYARQRVVEHKERRCALSCAQDLQDSPLRRLQIAHRHVQARHELLLPVPGLERRKYVGVERGAIHAAAAGEALGEVVAGRQHGQPRITPWSGRPFGVQERTAAA